jgi:hypothetical protein
MRRFMGKSAADKQHPLDELGEVPRPPPSQPR